MTEEKSLFTKYPSIEQSEKEYIVQKIRNHGYEHICYCITEKIHGSNTQIDYDLTTGKFEYNKRSGLIAEGEKCYNVQAIFENLKGNIKDLAKYLSAPIKAETGKDLEVVKVFGEIFGGHYPHPDVQRVHSAMKVQKGVWYCPDNYWMAFDVAYKLKGDDRTYFLSAEDFFIACAAVEIPTVPVLKIASSLTQALEYPNDGKSVVYKQLGLPELEDNIMEGVVIRPAHKDLWMGQTRVILKNKNERFKEKSHEARPELTIEYSDNVNKALAEVSAYITENRVENVISHEGEVKEEDIGKLIGLTSKDIFEEYTKDSEVWSSLEKIECKIVSKHVAKNVAPLVRAAVYRRLAEQCV